jgi:hypothetical protein
VDRLTKVAHFIPVKTTYSGAKLAKLYISNTTRKVIISDDLLVTLLTLVTGWYVFHDEMSIFVISCE